MTVIESNSSYATLINVFTVEPDQAAELIRVLDEATETVMRHIPGFRTANIHLSTDHTRVVNYAQWDSGEAYAAMFEDPVAREHMAIAAALAISFEPHLYTVHSVHGN